MCVGPSTFSAASQLSATVTMFASTIDSTPKPVLQPKSEPAKQKPPVKKTQPDANSQHSESFKKSFIKACRTYAKSGKQFIVGIHGMRNSLISAKFTEWSAKFYCTDIAKHEKLGIYVPLIRQEGLAIDGVPKKESYLGAYPLFVAMNSVYRAKQNHDHKLWISIISNPDEKEREILAQKQLEFYHPDSYSLGGNAEEIKKLGCFDGETYIQLYIAEEEEERNIEKAKEAANKVQITSSPKSSHTNSPPRVRFSDRDGYERGRDADRKRRHEEPHRNGQPPKKLDAKEFNREFPECEKCSGCQRLIQNEHSMRDFHFYMQNYKTIQPNLELLNYLRHHQDRLVVAGTVATLPEELGTILKKNPHLLEKKNLEALRKAVKFPYLLSEQNLSLLMFAENFQREIANQLISSVYVQSSLHGISPKDVLNMHNNLTASIRNAQTQQLTDLFDMGSNNNLAQVQNMNMQPVATLPNQFEAMRSDEAYDPTKPAIQSSISLPPMQLHPDAMGLLNTISGFNLPFNTLTSLQ